jgi:hypothetical protein
MSLPQSFVFSQKGSKSMHTDAIIPLPNVLKEKQSIQLRSAKLVWVPGRQPPIMFIPDPVQHLQVPTGNTNEKLA